MFVILPAEATHTDGSRTVMPTAVNAAQVQRIKFWEERVTRLTFVGDTRDRGVYIALPFDETVRRINDAMAAGV